MFKRWYPSAYEHSVFTIDYQKLYQKGDWSLMARHGYTDRSDRYPANRRNGRRYRQYL